MHAQKQDPQNRTEPVQNTLASLPVNAGDAAVNSEEATVDAIDQGRRVSVEPSLEVMAVLSEPVNELAVADKYLDSAEKTYATDGLIPVSELMVDSGSSYPVSAKRDLTGTDAALVAAVQVDAELQRFWGPFNAEVRAKSFASHLTKLVGSPMLVAKSQEGFYIAFEYTSRQQRTEILNTISANGLSLKLVQ